MSANTIHRIKKGEAIGQLVFMNYQIDYSAFSGIFAAICGGNKYIVQSTGFHESHVPRKRHGTWPALLQVLPSYKSYRSYKSYFSAHGIGFAQCLPSEALAKEGVLPAVHALYFYR